MSIFLFPDFAKLNLTLSSRTQNDKHENSASTSAIFTSNLDEMKIIKSIKTSNQVKA